MDKSSGLNLNREADPLQRTIQEQRARIVELEGGKAWLEEQWVAWKQTAEERERTIQELKTWIDQLEAGRAWLEKDRRYWKGLAVERRLGLFGLVLRTARRLFRRGKKEESTDLTAASTEGSWSPRNWPLEPISRELGHDRGLSLDRYYMEKFLEKHSTDIQGRVLEIGDHSYTLRYGGSRVEKSEVLNATEDNPLTSIIADLAKADLPLNQFDCIVLTQTLYSIYDLQSALKALHQILKPCGVLLATFPGITHRSPNEFPGSRHGSLTSDSAKQLFGEVFQPSNVVVEGYGNVLTTSAFLYGFSADELRQEDLEYRDPAYDLLITVRARKDQMAKADRHDLKLQRKAGSTEGRAFILLYHSIMPPMSDPWSLCVSPEHFEGHLQAIRELGTPLPLDEMIDRLTSGTLPPNAVALTFDDGYASILSQARPLLEQYEVPATMFISTAALSEAREFWWDALERIFLQPGNLPRTLELEIGKHHFHWDLGEEAFYTQEAFEQNLSWHPSQPAAGTRQRVYSELWELLHAADSQLIKETLDKLFDLAHLHPEPRATHRLITWTEVMDLKDDPWIRFGSHSMTHSSLASLPAEDQANELRQSKAALEAGTGRRITSLAYPYGLAKDYSSQTAALAHEAGYKMALINSPGVVDRNVDLFFLPRFYVEDWEKEKFAGQLFQWMEE
jgi:peptidoglycan/xylan/chitin deacetylase (PgdA/CDA1 family)/SAM-dependent methyltransferase